MDENIPVAIPGEAIPDQCIPGSNVNPEHRPAYEAALARLRAAAREFRLAAVAAVEASKAHDPYNEVKHDPFAAEAASDIAANLRAAAQSSDGMAEVIRAASLPVAVADEAVFDGAVYG